MPSRLIVHVLVGALMCVAPVRSGNLWVRTFDTGGHADEARSLLDTADGGLVFVGMDWSAMALRLVKVSPVGILEWQRSYAYGSAFVNPRRIVRTTDGGYAIAGNVNSKGLLLRFDSNGGLLWQRLYGSSSSDLYDVEVTRGLADFRIAPSTAKPPRAPRRSL